MNAARRTRRGGDRRGVGGVLPAVSLSKVRRMLKKKKKKQTPSVLEFLYTGYEPEVE